MEPSTGPAARRLPLILSLTFGAVAISLGSAWFHAGTAEAEAGRQLQRRMIQAATLLEQEIARGLSDLQLATALSQPSTARTPVPGVGPERSGLERARRVLAEMLLGPTTPLQSLAYIDRSGGIGWQSSTDLTPTLGTRIARLLDDRRAGATELQLGLGTTLVLARRDTAASPGQPAAGIEGMTAVSIVDGTLLQARLGPLLDDLQVTLLPRLGNALRLERSGFVRVPAAPEAAAAPAQLLRVPLRGAGIVELEPTGHAARATRIMLREDAALHAATMLAALLAIGGIPALWLLRPRAPAAVPQGQRLAFARAEARSRLAALATALPTAEYDGDLAEGGALRLRSASQGIAALTGYGPRDMRQTGGWRHLIAAEDLAAYDRFAATLRQAGKATADYRIRHRDGQEVWLRDTAQQLDAGPGRVLGLVIDVTAEHRLRAQVATQARLASLGELTAFTAHELAQPIGTIQLAAENILDGLGEQPGLPGAALIGRAERIHAQALRAGRTIAYLRMLVCHPGALPLEAVSVPDAVATALALSEARLQAAGVAVILELPDGLPPVCGQRLLLEQALANLCANACDAMAEGAGRRQLRIAAGDAGAGQLWLALRDTGPGFSPEAERRLFEPFFTTKDKGRGSGLGLSLSRAVLRSFQGELEVVHHADGAEIRLTLAALPPDAAGQRAALAAAAPAAPLRQMADAALTPPPPQAASPAAPHDTGLRHS